MATKNSSSRCLYVCKCGKKMSNKIAFLNHQKICSQRNVEDASDVDGRSVTGNNKNCSHSYLANTSDISYNDYREKARLPYHQQNNFRNKTKNKNRKQNLPVPTSSARRKEIAMKGTTSQCQAAESSKESATTDKHVKVSVSKSSVNNDKKIGNSRTQRKRPAPRQSVTSDDFYGSEGKKTRIKDKIVIDKDPRNEDERVTPNRISVVGTKGSGKLQCQEAKLLCDMIDEVDMVCLVCLRKFTRIYNLRSHAIRHLGLKRYRCKLCTFSSYYKCQCNTHILRFHSEILGSEASADNMIVDLNKEAFPPRSQKKNPSPRNVGEKDRKDATVSQKREQQCGAPGNCEREIEDPTVSQRKHQECGVPEKRKREGKCFNVPRRKRKNNQTAPPPSRKKAAAVEENVKLPQTTFDIPTRKSPQQFDTRPCRETDQMAPQYARKGYNPKANNDSDSESSGTYNSSCPSESSLSQQTRGDSASEDESDHSTSRRKRYVADSESISDGEFVPKSKGKAAKKRHLSAETKDMGYSCDRRRPKQKNNPSNYLVAKNRKLSGESTSSGQSQAVTMSNQDRFEWIRLKPDRTFFAESNMNNSAVRRVFREGAMNKHSQDSFTNGFAPSTSSCYSHPEDNFVVVDYDDKHNDRKSV